MILIKSKIFQIRGKKVMLDYDLAKIYGVKTKVLNQAIKRNRKKFPRDFMFQLNTREWKKIASISTVIKNVVEKKTRRSQNVTASKYRNKQFLPFAFTEHGVGMLASVLNSPKAIKMNVAIVRAFIALKEFASEYRELAKQIQELKKKTGDQDEQLKEIYSVIESLLNIKIAQTKLQTRQRRIGRGKR